MNIRFRNLNQRHFKAGDRVYGYQSEFKKFSKFKVLFVKENEGVELYFCGRLGEKGEILYIETFFKDGIFTSKEMQKIKKLDCHEVYIIG